MTFTRTDDAARSTQPRGPAQVEVFRKGRPERPNVELGIIESKADGDATPPIEKMREYAGELGCDALVVSADQVHTYRGSCLVYTEPPLLQPPPAAAGSNSGTACIPNSPQQCYGQGGCHGNQVCSADGKSFSACDCASPGSP